jgi:hypothetical protein
VVKATTPSQAVAAVAGRVGAIEDVDTVNFPGLDGIPAWRGGEIGAEKVAQQKPVAVDQRAGGLEGMHVAKGEQSILVADKTFTDQQIGLVFDYVFAVGGVDCRELGGRDMGVECDGLAFQGGLVPGDRDGIQFIGVCGNAGQQQAADNKTLHETPISS